MRSEAAGFDAIRRHAVRCGRLRRNDGLRGSKPTPVAERSGLARLPGRCSVIALLLDRGLAGHVAIAINSHRKALRKDGWSGPRGLAELEIMLAQVISGQEGSPVDDPPITPDNASVKETPLLLSYEQGGA